MVNDIKPLYFFAEGSYMEQSKSLGTHTKTLGQYS